MLHASTQKLIIKLCELTALGDIQWREGRNGAVMLETEGYIVEAEGQPAKVRVLNADGAELEHADTDQLAAAWPDGEGSFAEHVATMVLQAHRLARGTDHAISRILSSLSAPQVAVPAPEAGARPLSENGGPESEAAMAAAVADMAIRIHRTPLQPANDAPMAPVIAPVIDPTPMEPEATAVSFETPESPAAIETPVTPDLPPRTAPPAEPIHFKRSGEMFGRTRSFVIAGRTHHRPSTEARPISSLGKITASGLVMPNTLFGSREQAEVSAIEEPITTTAPPVVVEETAPSAPRPIPTPASPDAYKPWV
jgi:hypothetical protein